ncbi:unnamed protein product, partial [Rotaria socialis]
SYKPRSNRQQQQRRHQKQASSHILNNIDYYSILSDNDSILDIENECSIGAEENTTCTQDDICYSHDSNSYTITYKPDDDDFYWNENLTDSSSDSSSPLYENSYVSVKTAATTIMSMAIELNFPKSAVERILKVFKLFLPTPNLLPTTYSAIIKTIDVMPSEVVTLDIKKQLKSIITRNISLIGKTELMQPFDINAGAQYKASTTLPIQLNNTYNNSICPITLNVHTDGAPLVRTTKSALWPCLASIVELPPQVREKQANILVLCLWTSCIKPDVNIFMNDCIQQLLELSVPSSLIVNNLQFSITVKTQLFVSDLPAKALFWKTINYNGYNACSNCFTEGVYQNRQVLYPYNKNSYRQRTHVEFLATAQEVDNRISSGRKGSSIDGIKGTSPLLQIFEYPKQIILDYMHLCCLGHMSTLIHRWLTMLNTGALAEINSNLVSQRFPHNISVNFNYPLNSCSDWKAKHFRIFLLSIGLPYMLVHLPPIVVSHFALYSMFVKLLHCPKSYNEIDLADKIIHYYCRTAPHIYGETIELFSLHSHLHLPQQVLTHGVLCFTSAFCFESSIRYLKKKAHGTRNLGTQIADWINIETIVTRPPFELSKSTGVNSININNRIFDKYRNDFLNILRTFIQNENDIVLFLRFKDVFVTYHTVLYDLPFSCCSYIISYKSTDSSIKYGQVIIFLKYHDGYYAYIQEYKATEKNISDYVSVPAELKSKLDEIFPLRSLSKSYTFVPIVNICHKCIQVKFHDCVFLSEVRVDYEHD